MLFLFLSFGQRACTNFFKSFVINQSFKFLMLRIPIEKIEKINNSKEMHITVCSCGMSGEGEKKEENLRVGKNNIREHVRQNKNCKHSYPVCSLNFGLSWGFLHVL